MRYREHATPPVLRPFVRCLWELEHDYGDSAYSRERLWATPYAELLVIRAGGFRSAGSELRGVVFMGPRTLPVSLVSDQRVELMAARFEVGGAADLLACPPSDVVDVAAHAPDVGVPLAATSLAELSSRLGTALRRAVADPVVVTAARIVEERGGRASVELRAERAMGNARWLEVAPPGAASALVLYPKAMMPDWETRRPSVVFEVEDIEATCSRLAEGGVSFAKPLTEMPWGKFASFLDTEGNEFGLRE